MAAMSTFVATMTYELSADTSSDARKLLKAELAARRWEDRQDGQRLPAGTVWMRRGAPAGHTVDALFEDATAELRSAVAAVAGRGEPITLLRAWLHISGAGTYGLARLP
jgi:hypothetical protein